MDPAHRKSPNRKRELREKVNTLVRQRIGAGSICGRCHATLGTYGETCNADLDERCPGFNAIDLQTTRAEKDLGLR
jgi:ribosomal protein L40E